MPIYLIWLVRMYEPFEPCLRIPTSEIDNMRNVSFFYVEYAPACSVLASDDSAAVI